MISFSNDLIFSKASFNSFVAVSAFGHVPGHSPGSLVYYCKEENCMFSGDVLFQGSIGRADLSGGNFDELIDHICSRLFVLPNETVVYPGHGAPTTIGMEKAENPFFR